MLPGGGARPCRRARALDRSFPRARATNGDVTDTSTAAAAGPAPGPGATPFHDLDSYVALPRLSGLALSPDGSRLVTSLSTLDPEQTRYISALWEVDPSGARPARRLTRSAKGESGAAFLPDGSLLFVSARPDPDTKPAADDAQVAALWQLPAGGGEARVVATRPGGISGVVTARTTGRVLVSSATLPGAVTAEDDEKRRKQRKERKVAAILHESYPVRYWDHDLGPDQARLLAGDLGGGTAPERVELTDLTPSPGRSLDEAGYDLTPDGSTVVTVWQQPERGGRRASLAAIDVATGARRMLLDDPELEVESLVRISPDGSRVAVALFRRPTATEPPDVQLAVVDLSTSAVEVVAGGWDAWPAEARWTPDGAALIVVADAAGAAPVFRLELASGEVTRLTGDHGAYSDLQVSPDGSTVFALRAAVDAAPAPVRLAAGTPGQQPVPLQSPAAQPVLPGTLTEVHATAADGSALRAWLVLPDGSGPTAPAPLLLWIHGGPLGSWNAWSWRWNPWLMAAQGYAVLLPDPALSTGYGREFIRRGWGRWGLEPFTDLMTITDAALQRDDLDAARTAAMGGSFGGYMANWVAGHTDRFRGDRHPRQPVGAGPVRPDDGRYDYWRREMSEDMVRDNSPHRFVAQIRTPMLVIHGDRDYRVPIGEGLRLWSELAEHHAAPDGSMPHQFLYFPDENHWVLSPQHAKVWYSTVLAFLASTVHGQPWEVPDILR